jgi:hypothetical protein
MGFLKDIDFDRESRRALMCACIAGVAGTFFGCAQKSAALAAVSSVAAAALRPQLNRNESFNKQSENGKRVIETIIAVPLTAIAAHQLGYRLSQEALLVAFAATFAGGHSKVDDNKTSDILVSAAIGFMIGTVRPSWFSPWQGAALMAAVAAQKDVADKAYNHQPINSAHMRPFLQTAYLFSIPLIATRLGFPLGLEQLACAAVLHQAIPVARDMAK